MRRHHRRINRRGRQVGILLLLLLFLATFMVSCVAGTDAVWIQSVLGKDLKVYAEEATGATLSADAPRVREMKSTVKMLVGNTLTLAEFRNSGEVVELYRDQILNKMLNDGYVKYTGDRTASAAVAATDPYLQACSLIPAADFESTVTRLFGGGSVSNKSGRYFTYLHRAGYYSIPIEPWESTVEVEVQGCEETAHAYRLYFTLTDGEAESAPYTAYFVKRSDGSCYMRGLTAADA